MGTPLLQEILARQSLRELGVSYNSLQVNHLDGINAVDGVDLDVLYPLSWVRRSLRLTQEKIYRYVFIGLIGPDRSDSLNPYRNRSDTFLKETRLQRLPLRKGRFRSSYWTPMHQSEFALCPQRSDWPGSKSRAWTYRFVEATLSFSIPVVFDETPLGSDFVKDYCFVNSKSAGSAVWDPEAAVHNFHITLRRHVLPDSLIRFTRC